MPSGDPYGFGAAGSAVSFDAMGDKRHQEQRKLPPACEVCGGRLGVYEPIVVDEEPTPTSWLRLSQARRSNGLRAWHPGCFEGWRPVPDQAG